VEQQLINISMMGARALLYLLFLLSILSIAVTILKYKQYRRDNTLGSEFPSLLVEWLEKGDVASALRHVQDAEGANAAILREGLRNFQEPPAAIEKIMASRTVREKNRLEAYLMVLGTIGNNAPFIGLLGTVMGIIKAFHDLAMTTVQGPQTVMAGISEALVATAVGLFVAIPAVVFYNWLQGRSQLLLDEADANSKIVLAFAERQEGERHGRS
jgi:biopolymer transport protein ExbB